MITIVRIGAVLSVVALIFFFAGTSPSNNQQTALQNNNKTAGGYSTSIVLLELEVEAVENKMTFPPQDELPTTMEEQESSKEEPSSDAKTNQTSEQPRPPAALLTKNFEGVEVKAPSSPPSPRLPPPPIKKVKTVRRCKGLSPTKCSDRPQCYVESLDNCRELPEFLVEVGNETKTSKDAAAAVRRGRNGDGELTCVGQVVDEPPCPPEGGALGSLTKCDRFKCATSWMYNHWRDWDCGREELAFSNAGAAAERQHKSMDNKMASSESADDEVLADSRHQTFSAGHDRNNGDAYTLHNVCVSPFGGLSGVSPSPATGKYRGKDETKGIYHTNKHFENFLNDVRPIHLGEDDGAPAATLPHYTNMSAFFMPLSEDALSNTGHLMHRVVSALQIMHSTFGVNQENVLVIFVMSKKMDLFLYRNAMATLMPIMGSGRWASVFTKDVNWEKQAVPHFALHGNRGINRGDKKLLRESTAVCFKKAVAWHNCVDCGAKARSSEKHQKFEYSLWSERVPRHVDMSARFRNAIAKCLGVTPRTTANTDSPKIVISYRSWNRGFLNFSFVVKDWIAHMKKVNNASSVRIIETFRTPLSTYMKAVLDADVLLGPHGSGLAYAALQPEGGALGEIRNHHFLPLNKKDTLNQHTFGIQIYSRNLILVPFTMPDSYLKFFGKLFFQYDFPLAAMNAWSDAISIALKGETAPSVRNVREQVDIHQQDPGGFVMRHLLNQHLYPRTHTRNTSSCLKHALLHARVSGEFRVNVAEVRCGAVATATAIDEHKAGSPIAQIVSSYVSLPDLFVAKATGSDDASCVAAVRGALSRETNGRGASEASTLVIVDGGHEAVVAPELEGIGRLPTSRCLAVSNGPVVVFLDNENEVAKTVEDHASDDVSPVLIPRNAPRVRAPPRMRGLPPRPDYAGRGRRRPQQHQHTPPPAEESSSSTSGSKKEEEDGMVLLAPPSPPRKRHADANDEADSGLS